MRMATLLLPGLMFLGACATTQDLVNRVPMPGVLERESNEARIAAVLYDVEEGMERGRVFKVVSHISPRYRDQAGRDYEELAVCGPIAPELPGHSTHPRRLPNRRGRGSRHSD